MKKRPGLYAILISIPFCFYVGLCAQMTAIVDFNLFPSYIGEADLLAALAAGTVLGIIGAVLSPAVFSKLLAEMEVSTDLSGRSLWLLAAGWLTGFCVGSYLGLLVPLMIFSNQDSASAAIVSSLFAIAVFAISGCLIGFLGFKAAARLM